MIHGRRLESETEEITQYIFIRKIPIEKVHSMSTVNSLNAIERVHGMSSVNSFNAIEEVICTLVKENYDWIKSKRQLYWTAVSPAHNSQHSSLYSYTFITFFSCNIMQHAHWNRRGNFAQHISLDVGGQRYCSWHDSYFSIQCSHLVDPISQLTFVLILGLAYYEGPGCNMCCPSLSLPLRFIFPELPARKVHRSAVPRPRAQRWMGPGICPKARRWHSREGAGDVGC